MCYKEVLMGFYTVSCQQIFMPDDMNRSKHLLILYSAFRVVCWEASPLALEQRQQHQQPLGLGAVSSTTNQPPPQPSHLEQGPQDLVVSNGIEHTS